MVQSSVQVLWDCKLIRMNVNLGVYVCVCVNMQRLKYTLPHKNWTTTDLQIGIRILWQPPSSQSATYRKYLFGTMKNSNSKTVLCSKILSLWSELCLQKFLYILENMYECIDRCCWQCIIYSMFHKQQSGAAMQTRESCKIKTTATATTTSKYRNEYHTREVFARQTDE